MTMEEEVPALRERVAALEANLRLALECWEEAAAYKGEYLAEKHGDAEEIAAIRAGSTEALDRLLAEARAEVDCIQTQNTGRACAALDEPGWVRIGRYDRARRRALWLRVSDDAIELRSGREGDDSYARITKAAPHFEELRELFQRADHSGGPSCFCGEPDCTGNTPEERIPDDWADVEVEAYQAGFDEGHRQATLTAPTSGRCVACGHEDRP